MATNESAVEVPDTVPAPAPPAIPELKTEPAPDHSAYTVHVGKRFRKDGGIVQVIEFHPRYAAGDGLIKAFRLEPPQTVPADQFLKEWEAV